MLQKSISSQKQKEWTEPTEFCIFKLVLVANFIFNWKFGFSGPKLSEEGISSLNKKKINPTIQFCICESVYIPNFSFNWEFWFFWTICPKNYFRSKTDKVKNTNEVCIFELVPLPNFSLSWKFWFFRPNLSKKGISKKIHGTIECCMFKYISILNLIKELTCHKNADKPMSIAIILTH